MGQEALVAPGPQVELPSALRSTFLYSPERQSLLIKLLGGQENPAFGVPRPFRIEGPRDWLAGAGSSKGVLSSVPTPVGVGRTASAICRQQLVQTQTQAMRRPPRPPVPDVYQSQTLSTLPASWVKVLAGASGS